jgi:hypothetical protein
MVNAEYHRAWRAKKAKDPVWVENRQQAYKLYIQRKIAENPEWHKKRVASKRESYLRHRVLKPRHKQSREERQIHGAEYYQHVKAEVIKAYGGICDCCGETDLGVLSIDHIGKCRPEGQKKRHGMNLYLFLKKSCHQEGYRVLCLNCNIALGFYGYCPHKGIPQKRSMSARARANQAYSRRLKGRVIDGYGGRCVHCGETTFEFLAIDHINGGERRHRKTLSRSLYNMLVEQKYPAGYQVLCANCNWRKHTHGNINKETEKETPEATIRLPANDSTILSNQ